MPPTCHSAEGEAEEAFAEAVERGAINECRRLVRERLCDARSQPDLLFVACEHGHDQVVLFLLQEGVGVKQSLADGTTPLHVACSKGHEAVVSVLLQSRADVDPLVVVHANLGPLGCITPLYACCGRGYTGIARLLVAAHADPHVQLLRGRSPLHVAVSSGHTETVKELVGSVWSGLERAEMPPPEDGSQLLLVSAVAAHQPSRIPLVLQRSAAASAAATAIDVSDNRHATPHAPRATHTSCAAAATAGACAAADAALASFAAFKATLSTPSAIVNANARAHMDQILAGLDAPEGSGPSQHAQLPAARAHPPYPPEPPSPAHAGPASVPLNADDADAQLRHAMRTGELSTLRSVLEDVAAYASVDVVTEARAARDMLRAKERRAYKKSCKAAAKEAAASSRPGMALGVRASADAHLFAAASRGASSYGTARSHDMGRFIEGCAQMRLSEPPADPIRSVDDICVRCSSAPRTHILVPCGHLCLCGRCAAALSEPMVYRAGAHPPCPICGMQSEQFVRVIM